MMQQDLLDSERRGSMPKSKTLPQPDDSPRSLRRSVDSKASSRSDRSEAIIEEQGDEEQGEDLPDLPTMKQRQQLPQILIDKYQFLDKSLATFCNHIIY